MEKQHERTERTARRRTDEAEARTADAWAHIARLEARPDPITPSLFRS